MESGLIIVMVIISIVCLILGIGGYFVWSVNRWKYTFFIHDPTFSKYVIRKARIKADETNKENKYFIVKDFEGMELPFQSHTSEMEGKRVWDVIRLPTGNLAYASKKVHTQIVKDDNGKILLDKNNNPIEKKLIDYELETMEKEQLTNAFLKKMRNHTPEDSTKILAMILSVIVIVMLCITMIVAWYYYSKISENFAVASQIQAETVKNLLPIYAENTQTIEIIMENLAEWSGKNYTKNFTRTIEVK